MGRMILRELPWSRTGRKVIVFCDSADSGTGHMKNEMAFENRLFLESIILADENTTETPFTSVRMNSVLPDSFSVTAANTLAPFDKTAHFFYQPVWILDQDETDILS